MLFNNEPTVQQRFTMLHSAGPLKNKSYQIVTVFLLNSQDEIFQRLDSSFGKILLKNSARRENCDIRASWISVLSNNEQIDDKTS